MKSLFLTVAVFAIIHTTSNAQQQIEMFTERPAQTESAGTIKEGSLQFEAGILYYHENFDDLIKDSDLAPETIQKNDVISLPNLMLRYALTSSTEFRVGADYVKINISPDIEYFTGGHDKDFINYFVVVKQEIIDDNAPYKVSAILVFFSNGHFTYPDTRNNLLSLKLIGEYSVLGFEFTLNAGGGYGFFLEDFSYIYALKIGYNLTEDLKLFGETSSYYSLYDHMLDAFRNDQVIDIGAQFELSDALAIDFSIGTGITKAADLTFASTGFKLKF